MGMFRKKLAYFLSALWYAFVFFYWTMFMFENVAGRNVLYATIWNTAVIVFFVISEKLEDYIYLRVKRKSEDDRPGIFRRILIYYLSGASFKTSLYLFYFIMLICNALVTADPDFPILRHLTDYFKSVYYGILILFAADTFLSRLLDDVLERRILKLEAELNEKKAQKEQDVEKLV